MPSRTRLTKLSAGVALGLTLATLPLAAQVPAPGATPRDQVTTEPPGARPAAGPPAPASTAAFWEVLGDPTLERLLEEALSGSPRLMAAEARIEGALASRVEAQLDLAPAVTASAGYTRRRLASASFPGLGTLPDQDVWDSGLQASWELDLFGRLRSGLRARNALLSSASEELEDTEVQLTAAVARSYFDLRGAQEQLAVATRNAENQRRTLELTEVRLEAGRGTEFDSERARAQLAFTRAAVPLLEERVASAQHRIAVLLGRPPRELAEELGAEGGLPALPESVPEVDPAEVIRVRPDVQAAAERVTASRALVSSARADYLPRISLAAGAGYTANEVDAFGNSGTFNYAFGPVISWAALDMGRVRARVDEARAQELESRARYDQAVLLAQEELESATVRYRTARARLGHLREAAAASERAASLAALRYEGGIADFLQVLDAERTLLVAQDQLAQAQTQATDAYVALYEARGASWPSRGSGRR